MAAFFDTMSSVKKYQPLAGTVVRHMFGVVLFNNDPKQIGRIKVKIDGLLPFDDHKQLPWVFSLLDPGLRGPLPSGFGVPTVNSWVLVMFPHDSIYQGFYYYW